MRVRHWLKRKKALEVEAEVSGFKPGSTGKGNADLIGAVEFSVRDGHALKPKTPRPTTKDKAQVLVAFLVSHHLSQKSDPVTPPLTQEQISDALKETMGKGWSQPTVHRLMNLVFRNGGMAEYEHLCLSGAIVKKGILKKYEDGTADIDAIVEDEQDD